MVYAFYDGTDVSATTLPWKMSRGHETRNVPGYGALATMCRRFPHTRIPQSTGLEAVVSEVFS
jgi:hypothetical protein